MPRGVSRGDKVAGMGRPLHCSDATSASESWSYDAVVWRCSGVLLTASLGHAQHPMAHFRSLREASSGWERLVVRPAPRLGTGTASVRYPLETGAGRSPAL